VSREAVGSQTLDRGLTALKNIAAAERPMSVQEVADGLGVHRSVAYRLVRTLLLHGLLELDHRGLYSAGLELATLARSVRRSLQVTALPELSDVASDLGITAFLVVPDGAEAVTLSVVEPRLSQVHVVRRPGTRHRIDRGAPGLAILAGAPPRPRERPDVTEARARGWAHTSGEVIEGAHAVAVPLHDRRREVVGSIAVVHMDATMDSRRVALRLQRAAKAIMKDLP
jgi:DNA-binding IclR family transcriptional regulator